MSSVLLSDLSVDAITTHICQDDSSALADIPVYPERHSLPNSMISTGGSL